jgi:hypothetical protein
MQLAAEAPAERTMLNVVFWATTVKLAKVSKRLVASERLIVFISSSPSDLGLCTN